MEDYIKMTIYEKHMNELYKKLYRSKYAKAYLEDAINKFHSDGNEEEFLSDLMDIFQANYELYHGYEYDEDK